MQKKSPLGQIRTYINGTIDTFDVELLCVLFVVATESILATQIHASLNLIRIRCNSGILWLRCDFKQHLNEECDFICKQKKCRK